MIDGGAIIRPVRIREGADSDAEGFIRLIGEAWAEYPNCILDVDGENPELRALVTHFGKVGGAVWTADQGGEVVGMVAVRPLGSDNAWEICRVYVRRDQRGTGLAHQLLDLGERRALDAGAERLVLWTDTRFDAAHAFYEKRGYVRSGSIRILDDISNSLEFRYAKPARGLVVEALDAAAAASAERRLAAILVACVASGASVSFLPPLPKETARSFWRNVSSDVATGKRLLLAAWSEGQIAGTVQLVLDTPANQPHRAEIAKLLVDPAFRRRGIARALMRKAEQAARGVGRRLLTLDTRSDGPAEALYHEMGWTEAGRIPGYALDAQGVPHGTTLFWKAL